MRALKRQDILTLRQGAANGRKVLYIWDRAGIDFRQWSKWKESGIYFLSREKENMKLEILGIHSFDRVDPINQRVISDELGETKSWASTPNAKTCKARLLCLTHNLMTLMEEQIFRETGIRNEAEIKRKAQTLATRDKDSRSKGCSGLTVL
jgi:hypothetical protein